MATSVVVDGIDFDILKGETFGLLGPNGAGKTTTILMMLGLTEVSAGEVRVMGHDPVREPLAVKRRVGYLPDAVGFYDNMTAVENLAYTARLMGFARNVREARIADALARVRLVRCRPQAGRDLLARHAPAARPRRADHEAAPRSPSWTSRPRASTRSRPTNSST